MNWILGRLRRRHLASEIEAHLDERVDELIEAGLDEATARQQARRELGNAMKHLETGREVWSWPFLDGLAEDFRYAARNLRRAPLFAGVVIGILAVGIGANVAVFGVVNAAVFKPLPVRDPGRLVRLERTTGVGTRLAPFSYHSNYLTYRTEMETLADVALHRHTNVRIGTGPATETIDAWSVSGSYFGVLGLGMRVGRPLTLADDSPGAAGVVVISDRMWRGRFGSDPDVLGQTLRVNGQPLEIVGVAPPGFRGVGAPFLGDVWIPWLSSVDPNAERREGNLIGRLAPERTAAEAEAELSVLAGQAAEATKARTFPGDLHEGLEGLGAFLLALTSLILVVAAANLGNLILGRGAARNREIATRLALGASRWKVVRLLLTESLLLAVAGGSVALLTGRWVALGLAGIELPIMGMELFGSVDLGYDWRVALFTISVSFATVLVFGLAPALENSRVALPGSLGAAAFGSLRRARWRAAFLAVQFGAGAALLVTGVVFMYHMLGIDLADRGFETDGVFVVLAPTDPQRQDGSAARRLVVDLALRLGSREGVEASLARDAPLNDSGVRVRIQAENGREVSASATEVSEGHFRLLEIPLLAGRDFEAGDRAAGPTSAIVNETLGSRLWPAEPALGKRFRRMLDSGGPGPWLEVTGLAADSRYVDPMEGPTAFVYFPLPEESTLDSRLRGMPMPSILLKTNRSEEEVQALVLMELEALDPLLPPPRIRPIDALIDLNHFAYRMLSVLGAVVGTLALLLASIGTFGVVAYLATQRRLEIGICLALGATRGHILRRISGPVVMWSVVGIGAGGVLTAGVLRTLPIMNGPVGQTPLILPVALIAAIVLLTVSAFLAGTLPALASVRNDPIRALRN